MDTQTDKFFVLARIILENKINEGSIPEDEQEDILRNCLVDIIEKYSDEEILINIPQEIIERIVDKNLRKYINQIVTPEGIEAKFEDEEMWYHLVDEVLPENLDLDNFMHRDYKRLDEDIFRYFNPILKEPRKILLYKAKSNTDKIDKISSDLIIVNSELIKYLKQHPGLLYKLDPRKFEELVAEILRDMGFMIELTKITRDGGIDIFATQKTNVGESLLIVDCKRYLPDKHVGVGLVRSLYGVTEQLGATQGMIATTSYFSEPAREFQKMVKYRMLLKDFNDISAWLKGYGISER